MATLDQVAVPTQHRVRGTINRNWRSAIGLKRCANAAGKARSGRVSRTFYPPSRRSRTAI